MSKKMSVVLVIVMMCSSLHASVGDKGLVGNWSLSQTDETLGAELYTSANAASITNEANATTGWTNAGMDTFESSAVQKYSGDYSMHFTADGDGQYAYTSTTVVVGKIYRISLYYYGENFGGSTAIRINLGTSGNDTSYLSRYSQIQGAWTELTIDIVPTSTNLFISVAEADVGNDPNFYIDALTVKEIQATDLTPYANNGANYGATYTTDRNGQSNKAMSFNGTSNYINIDSVLTEVADDTQGTWSAWVKPTTAISGGNQGVLSVGDTDGSEYVWFGISSTGLLRVVCKDTISNSWAKSSISSPFSDGVWTHIALVQDGTSPVIYANGIAIAQEFTDSSNITHWMTDLTEIDNTRISALSQNGGGNLFLVAGSISNVRIYDRALTAEEVAELADSYNPSLVSDTKGLVGQWNLDSESEVVGSELYTSANASSIGNEANATTGWTNTGLTTFESSASQHYAGSYSMHGISDSNGDRMYTSTTVVVGKRYRLSFYTYVDGVDKGIKFYVGTADLDDSYSVGEGNSTTGSWQKFTVDFTATTTSVFATIREQGISADVSDFYVDSFTVKEIQSADSTPYANNGTNYNASTTTDRMGQADGATIFDGGSSYIDIGNDVLTDVTRTQASWSFWIKRDSYTENAGIIAKYEATNGKRSWNIRENTVNALYMTLSADGTTNDQITSESNLIENDEWIHIVITYNAGVINFYKNGVFFSTDTSTQTNLYANTTQPAWIGKYLDYFDGSISNVKIYNRALTAEEIKREYDSYNPVVKLSSLNKGLIGRWGLTSIEGGTGSTTYDMTPYENNGTRMGDTAIASIYTTDRNGQSDKAQDFDGSSDYVNIDGVVADVANDTTGTWAMWVKPDLTIPPATEFMLSFSDTDSSDFMYLAFPVTTGILRAIASDGGTTQWLLDIDVAPFTSGVWTHIALVQNGTSPVLYVDGVAVAQTLNNSTDTTVWFNTLTGIDNARIGDRSAAGVGEATHFAGSISNVRIYNRALSAEEIKLLYESH